ncbi:ABC transporter substrate-binding protein [Granulosicoccus antarcticus]|uniref:Leucine-binding protein domain-containing protein n=1 Tax=Granulosicoccus antarcticus IMCC3135 TaxID=1192854 RepID=A0A2Z2NIN8_9GAMM|nr:ABC transporter substrate-binding protein [Granulosicoccus antarcticus]ASJ70923.1 hypothetical protein IMCC3135_04050 [Granulosicoccus antarcticus IMCC3135]
MESRNTSRYLITLLVVALSGMLSSTAIADKDIMVGHLTYHTGDYGSFGPFFDGVTDFTLAVINEDPPLGRRMSAIHQDIGTIGEERAVKKLLNIGKVEIVLNVAHEYLSYRDYLLKRISFLKKPLMPSVHGGAIDAMYGGNAEEPLFRGSPMDSAQSAAAMLYIKNSGKKSVVLVATESAGHLLQMEAAKKSAERLGIQVLKSMVIQDDWTDYSSVIEEIAEVQAEAVAVFSAPRSGGIFIKNAAEAGNSWFLVGTSEWQEQDFVKEATIEAVRKHEAVVMSAYAHARSPAWGYYKNAAEASDQIDVIGDVANSYALQYYDLLVASALAIEKAGKIDASKWASAMFAVTAGGGELVYSYAQGLAAIRAGKEINYDGVTGSMEFTDTGVVAGLFGIFEWASEDSVVQVSTADGDVVAELGQE